MIIIIGLGNPGEKFESTRHNAGFMAVDFFAKKNDFPEFEMEKKYDSLVSEKDKIMIVKPQTFMNKSGDAAKKIISKNKKADFIVIHDDIDLPLGKLKIVKNRGSAGHKGVESIIKTVGNKNLIRFRIGINSNPPTGGKKTLVPEKFVIKDFTEDEKKLMTKTINRISEALQSFIENGLDKTMGEYNKNS